MEIDHATIKAVLDGWKDATENTTNRADRFLGKNKKPTPEKFLLVLSLVFDIMHFAELLATDKIKIMAIRGAMHALGADGIGTVHDNAELVRGLIAAKAFPESVPHILEELKEDSPASKIQKEAEAFQQAWSSMKKQAGNKRKVDDIEPHVNDQAETPARPARRARMADDDVSAPDDEDVLAREDEAAS